MTLWPSQFPAGVLASDNDVLFKLVAVAISLVFYGISALSKASKKKQPPANQSGGGGSGVPPLPPVAAPTYDYPGSPRQTASGTPPPLPQRSGAPPAVPPYVATPTPQSFAPPWQPSPQWPERAAPPAPWQPPIPPPAVPRPNVTRSPVPRPTVPRSPVRPPPIQRLPAAPASSPSRSKQPPKNKPKQPGKKKAKPSAFSTAPRQTSFPRAAPAPTPTPTREAGLNARQIRQWMKPNVLRQQYVLTELFDPPPSAD